MIEEEFSKKLAKVEDLMKEEKFKDAIIILDKLKQIEQKGDFDYSLTHKLYQLNSNTHSLYHQQVIINEINNILLKQKFISFKDLNQIIIERTDLKLNDEEFKKEIELLILRGILKCNIEGDLIVF